MALPCIFCCMCPAGFHNLTQNPFPLFPRSSKSQFSVNLQISASHGAWKEIIDPASRQPYYWNTETNETSWQRPTNRRIDPRVEEGASYIGTKLPLDELTKILLAAASSADTSRFGDVANQYRPQCFENEFFDHLAHIINCTEDKLRREEYEKLRARLANPLLKNPPPY